MSALHCQQQYLISLGIAAVPMSHSTDTHTRIYESWTDEDETYIPLERCIRYKLMKMSLVESYKLQQLL